MYIRFEDIKNVGEFFIWLEDYMGVGDKLVMSYDETNGDTFKLFNSCNCLLAEYSEEGGPISH